MKLPRTLLQSITCRRPMLAVVMLAFGLLVMTACGGGSSHQDTTPSNPSVATLYVNTASPANTVSAYRVRADGTLTAVAGSPFATGGAACPSDLGPRDSIAVSGNGQWVFASNCGSHTIAAFAVSSTGALTPIPGSPFPTGEAASSVSNMTVSAHDQFLFMTTGPKIAIFEIAASGALAPVPGSPFPIIGDYTGGMKLLPNDSFLFVSGTVYGRPPSSGIEAFRVGADGALTQSAVMGIYSELLDANCASTVLYLGLQAFNIAADGSLTEAHPPLELVDNRPSAMVLSPSERFLFITRGFNSHTYTMDPFTSTLAVGNDYSLQTLPGNPWFPLNTGADTGPHAITVDRTGSFVFTATLTTTGQLIAVQKVSSNGTLTLAPGSPVTSGAEQTQHSIAVMPRKQCG